MGGSVGRGLITHVAITSLICIVTDERYKRCEHRLLEEWIMGLEPSLETKLEMAGDSGPGIMRCIFCGQVLESTELLMECELSYHL
ncbi:hypothetical protein VNO78_07902 [Psophocarpus tetragonolobus]|uniref:Uncharacterized protein n=1 Tax=Psophocarpus tetragonolobus TaxID=3891 RepID=A0AAN9STV1_PSOTE